MTDNQGSHAAGDNIAQQSNLEIKSSDPNQEPLTANLPQTQAFMPNHIVQQQQSREILQVSSIQPNSEPHAQFVATSNRVDESNRTVSTSIVQLQQQSTPPSQQYTIQPLLAPDNDNMNAQSNLQPSTTVINVPNQVDGGNKQPGVVGQEQKSIITKVKLSDELNIFDWFRTTDIINQLAEKAKHSVDTVITALDPGMKEYLYSGGNINIMVISDSENLVSPIRDSFQSAFGRATVVAARYNPPEVANEFPIKLANGFDEALLVAKERIRRLRQDTNGVPQNQVIVAVQPSLICQKLDQSRTNDNDSSTKWYVSYCMVIEDPVLNTTLNSFSQFVQVDSDVLRVANEAKFPDNELQMKNLGFPISIDDIMNSKLRLAPSDSQDEFADDCRWIQEWSGLSRSQVVRELSISLAHSYRREWNECKLVTHLK